MNAFIWRKVCLFVCFVLRSKENYAGVWRDLSVGVFWDYNYLPSTSIYIIRITSCFLVDIALEYHLQFIFVLFNVFLDIKLSHRVLDKSHRRKLWNIRQIMSRPFEKFNIFQILLRYFSFRHRFPQQIIILKISLSHIPEVKVSY